MTAVPGFEVLVVRGCPCDRVGRRFSVKMLGKFNEVMGFVRHGGARRMVGQAHVPLLALMPQRLANGGAQDVRG